MTPRMIALAALAVAFGSGAQAQSFSGAEISAEALAFSDDSDFGQTTYNGSLEFSVFGGFSVAGDLNYYGFRGFGGNSTGATLHGLYSLGPDTAVGLFYGQDWTDTDTLDHYGVEGSTRFGGIGVEGFVGMVNGSVDATMLGVSGNYDIGNVFTATADFGLVDADSGSTTRASIGGEMTLFNGPQVYAELGQISTDINDEAFISLGARIALGPQGGTTFDSRGLFEILN